MGPHNRNILATWAMAVSQALDSRDIDSRAIFMEAGIDLGATRDPNSRFDAEQMTVVYELAEKTTQDPAFGLSIAEFIHPTSLHALGYSLFASDDLESFCRRVVSYFGLVSTNTAIAFEQTADQSKLIMVPEMDRFSFAPQDAWLATMLRFIRSIYRPDFNPVHVSLRRPKPGINSDKFRNCFQAPIEFGSSRNILALDSLDMNVRLPGANAELARQNDHVVMKLLQQIDRSDILIQVRARLIDLLPSGDCTKSNVAKALSMSERTLQNRLMDRATTYRQVLNELRQELATQYMSASYLSVSETTWLLGFTEVSSFSRAFRTWTGESPSGYRARIQTASERSLPRSFALSAVREDGLSSLSYALR